MRFLKSRSIGFFLLTLIGSQSGLAITGTISSPNCSYKIRDKSGTWKSYPGRIASGTAIDGKKVNGTAVFRLKMGSKEIFSSPISCVQFDTGPKLKTETPRVSKTYLTVSGAPQYLTASFEVDGVAVKGTLIGAAAGVGLIHSLSNFQFGATLVFGFASGSAQSTAAGYEVKFARGFYVLLPAEIYYGFGSHSLGVGAGLQYLSMDWPVESGSSAVTEPDSRFSYIADFGYRFMGDGFFINPRIGLLGGASLFAELRGGVAF
jgi:hypothetical protein